MENNIDYTSVADYTTINDYTIIEDFDSIYDDYISTENTIVYYIWNNMYDLAHHINHQYINHDDEALVLGQYNNIMKFLDEIS